MANGYSSPCLRYLQAASTIYEKPERISPKAKIPTPNIRYVNDSSLLQKNDQTAIPIPARYMIALTAPKPNDKKLFIGTCFV